MIRTLQIPPRDFSDLTVRLNSVGWFLPPFVSVGFIEQCLHEQEILGSGPFTQEHLETMLASLYGPNYLASMVLHRYPTVPEISLYAETIAEAVLAHFAGLPHVAVCGLMPVIEGAGRRLAIARNLGSDPNTSLKTVFENLAAHAKDHVVSHSIGAVSENLTMLDSFSSFIRVYFYANTTRYPLLDGTNRHGVLHGFYADSEYGRPLNFFKTIAAVDFLTYLSLLKPLNMSGFPPDKTAESAALAARYEALPALMRGS
jgi:hypothetical protein